jgi:alanine racemase
MKHRPIQATILTQNLCHNLSIAKKNSHQRPTWAVIKANAYGHSIEAALKGFCDSEGLALLDIEHAELCRKLGWQKKILLLEGVFSQQDFDEIFHLSCDFVIHHEEQVTHLLSWLKEQPSENQLIFRRNCDVWLKLNSGMNRLGFKSAAYGVAYEVLKNIGLTVHHLTHFANADDDTQSPSVKTQWDIFNKATQFFEGFKSAANSAAILHHPQTHADYIRPGIMLYGASPSGLFKDIASVGLKAGMNLRSEIIAIQELQVGDPVGYGGQFRASKNTKIAVIACGYADGYPRHAPNGTPVWIGSTSNILEGRLAPIAGRVSMDMITVDVTDMTDAKVGSPVELWGELLPIDEVAISAKTVGYELMCALAPRVKINID